MKPSPYEVELTNKIKLLEEKLNYQNAQINKLVNFIGTPVPEISLYSAEQGSSGGSTTYVNKYKGQVSILAGTNISIANTSNTITISNSYTLPANVLTSSSTYVKKISAGTNISISSTGVITNTYTLPTNVLTNTSTYVKTIPTDVLTNSSTYIKALTAGSGITLTTTATTKTVEIASSGSGGSSINYTFNYSTTEGSNTTYSLGSVKTGSNGTIICKAAFRLSTTSLPERLYFETTDSNISTFSIAQLTSNSYLTLGVNGVGGSAEHNGLIVFGYITGLTTNTTYTVKLVCGTGAFNWIGYYSEIIGT